MDALQSGQNITPETHRLVVGFIQRQPGEQRAVRACGAPGADQRGLAEASRGSDESQRLVESSGKPPQKSGSGNELGTRRRRDQLGGQQPVWLVTTLGLGSSSRR